MRRIHSEIKIKVIKSATKFFPIFFVLDSRKSSLFSRVFGHICDRCADTKQPLVSCSHNIVPMKKCETIT